MNYLNVFAPRFAEDVFDVMERDFSPFIEPFVAESPARRLPGVDVRETADSYVLEMDLPGRDEKDVCVELKDLVLSISAGVTAGKTVSKAEKAENAPADAESEAAALEADGAHAENQLAGRYLLRERINRADFSRHFTLPRDIDSSKVNAVFKNGVLTVTVMRKEEAKSAKILINAG
ncbi:MAG: hypothetical protein Ta2A_06440 [Treponemataceae bacterium]|nr:MAG: hypothetical protein Ta2A_06440 [Treponemataceae bacterium]